MILSSNAMHLHFLVSDGVKKEETPSEHRVSGASNEHFMLSIFL